MTPSDTPPRAASPPRGRGGGCCRPTVSLCSSWSSSSGILPQFTSMSEVWAPIRAMTCAGAGHPGRWPRCGTWPATCSSWSATTPGLTYRQAFVATESTTAVVQHRASAAAPIALGLTYAMNSSWGFSRSRDVGLAARDRACGTTSSSSACRCWPWRCWRCSAPPSAGRLARRPGIGLGALVVALVALAALLRSEQSAARVGRLLAGSPRPLLRLVRPIAGARLGAGDDEVPQPDRAPRCTPAGMDHPRHPGQPPLAVPRAAAGAARSSASRRRRGELARGARRVRLRPAAHRHPVHPRRRGHRRGRADHRAGRRRRSPASSSPPRYWCSGR